ncbi:MAG: Y-family DNA polymerase [Burkholderiaceae bacterium]
MYALVDGNNFYVSCERVFAPRLVGRPVVVLSSNDGACIARSNEAKDLGIEMAAPWFKVRHLEKTAGLIAVSANHELYSDMSARMMAVEARYAPRQEVYSVDESFLDFEGMRVDLEAIGRAMRAAILQETGLPTSVGFGATKTLAKLANHIGKTADRKPGTYPAHLAQVCDFARLAPHQLDALFAATEVGCVWGVGKRTTETLKSDGIHTVLDLVRADAAALRAQFSVKMEKTLLELRGTCCMSVDDAPARRQQILVSRSFGTAITDVDGIIEAVGEFTSRAAERLRQQGSVAGAIGLFFTTSPFRATDRQHGVNVTVPLPRPTGDTAVLVATATAIVRSHFRSGFRYAKAGAVLSGLQAAGHAQGELDLFAPSSPEAAPAGDARAKLMSALDALNNRFGRDSVRLGTTAVASNGAEVPVWATKQERRSPRFTTRWDELLVVRA